jgi:hypothetical protein
MKQVLFALLVLVCAPAFAIHVQQAYDCYRSVGLPKQTSMKVKIPQTSFSYYLLSPTALTACQRDVMDPHSTYHCATVPQDASAGKLHDILDKRIGHVRSLCESDVGCVRHFLSNVQKCKALGDGELDVYISELERSAQALIKNQGGQTQTAQKPNNGAR